MKTLFALILGLVVWTALSASAAIGGGGGVVIPGGGGGGGGASLSTILDTNQTSIFYIKTNSLGLAAGTVFSTSYKWGTNQVATYQGVSDGAGHFTNITVTINNLVNDTQWVTNAGVTQIVLPIVKVGGTNCILAAPNILGFTYYVQAATTTATFALTNGGANLTQLGVGTATSFYFGNINSSTNGAAFCRDGQGND